MGSQNLLTSIATLVVGMGLAGMVAWAGLELHLGTMATREIRIEWATSIEATNWNWWGTLTTTNPGTVLTVDERDDQRPSKFWRIREME